MRCNPLQIYHQGLDTHPCPLWLFLVLMVPLATSRWPHNFRTNGLAPCLQLEREFSAIPISKSALLSWHTSCTLTIQQLVHQRTRGNLPCHWRLLEPKCTPEASSTFQHLGCFDPFSAHLRFESWTLCSLWIHCSPCRPHCPISDAPKLYPQQTNPSCSTPVLRCWIGIALDSPDFDSSSNLIVGKQMHDANNLKMKQWHFRLCMDALFCAQSNPLCHVVPQSGSYHACCFKHVRA